MEMEKKEEIELQEQGKRLRQIRKFFELSQESFGKRIGNWTKGAISLCEKGKRKLSPQMISAICREFNVNEEWLIEGKNDMFQTILLDEKLAAFLGRILAEPDDSPRKQVFHLMEDLPLSWYESVLNYANCNSNGQNNKKILLLLQELLEQVSTLETILSLLKSLKENTLNIKELVKVQSIFNEIKKDK